MDRTYPSSASSGSRHAPHAGQRVKQARRLPQPQKPHAQGLKIVPYQPDSAKRKASRRNICAERIEDTGSASKEDAEKIAEEEHKAKQTDLLRNVERIPSSRSWDPFNALAVLYVSKEERFILNYAYTRSWKVWEDPFSGQNKFAQAWMWRSMESSAAFYAQIVGAASHYQISRRETPISSERLATVRLQAKAKAIERLRSEVEQFHRKKSSIPFDSLLMAVFCLAVHDNIDVRGKEEPHPFSELAKLRDMHIYGRVVFGEQHMEAMYQLIEQKGGLDTIDKHAFGPVIPLLDVIYAVRTQQKPRFACTKTLRSINHPSIWNPDKRAEELLDTLGSGFKDENLTFALEQGLQTTLLTLAEMTAGLDHFQRCGAKPFTNLIPMLDNTDWAAHRLASMSSFVGEEHESENEFDEDDLNEACRLAAWLYIDIVVFPTPPQAGVKDTMSALLLPILEKMSRHGEHMESLGGLALWAALIGAISARETALEDSYVALIKRLLVSLGGLPWDEAKELIKTFLWLSSVCDEPAKGVWERALEASDEDI